ncbi:hypothetical protein NBRC116494_29170 [Aurantivibrio plasticivorans]
MSILTVGKRCIGVILGITALVSGTVSAEENFDVSEESFKCLFDMTPVRGFFVDNLAGNVEETLAVAHSENGGRYPEGSVVQLVPGEVMVKRAEGTSPATKDWEFFELDVSSGKTKIGKRGFVDVVNRFGGNCFGCHVQAEPQWDLVCETGHGCDPLPIGKVVISAIQKTDQRCSDAPALTDAEKKALMQMSAAASQ